MISREKKIALYSAMLKYRALGSETRSKLPPSWQLTPGLEATVAAITADLHPADSFVATQSKLASALIRRSRWTDDLHAALQKAHARNGHISSGQLGREFAWALASARSFQEAKGSAISLVLCQARPTAALWRKQLQSASRDNLPIVFVRLTGPSRRPHAAPPAFAFGVPRIAVDAHDVLAVYRVASESVARARHRRGPTLIECVDLMPTDRAASGTSDPIHAVEVHLAKKRILNADLKQKIERRVSSEVRKTLRAMRA